MRAPLPIIAAVLMTALPACLSFAQAASADPALAQETPETKEHKDARMQWWREARFGMFIHWGIYSVPAGVYQGKDIPSLGEWIMNNGNIPVADYAKFAAQFNPTKFDSDKFVAIAKNAGMKYIVITSKHHDGFAMFKSADPFNVVDATPFHRDIIRELDDAARKAGLRFGVYYSQSQDWHHPGGFAYGRNGRKNGDHWDPAQDGSFDAYLNAVAIPQARELLTNYPLDVLWWDTPGNITKEEATKLHDLLKLQPNIITNNRLMNTKTPGAFQGDTETPEQRIPATGYADGRDFETCMTINGTWGFKSTDHDWKSSETLIRNLIDIASKGGNYLLNVGPTAEGEIPPESVERLADIGKWLAVNGEAIYGTGPNPFPAAPAPPVSAPATTRRGRTPPVVWDWRATTKPGKIYLHIMQWPTDGHWKLPPINGEIKTAYLLSDPAHAQLHTTVTGFGGTRLRTLVDLPKVAPDPIATVICLEVQNAQ
jgi:alpha-L-fucosidase